MNTPNVILLTIDTLRADMLGCYGHQKALTPNLDRLAASGIRFKQAITGGSWTQAAFPVLLTSSYPAMYGGCLGRLSPERPSPIEALALHGYQTGGFSTNPHLSRATGYDRGFQHFADLVPAEVDPLLRRIKGGQRLLRSPLTHAMLSPFGSRLRPARLYNSAADVTDSVCGWLERVEQPFFAWAHYMDTHWPYHLEETLRKPSAIAQAWQDLATMSTGSNSDRREPITSAQRDHFVGLYERSLAYMDAQIGRLLTCVDGLGPDANVVVIVVADHGEEFLDHGRWGHWESNLYDEILRVPFIIGKLGGQEGLVIKRQVRTIDLMPTILDLCGCPMPDNLLGTSLTPLWAPRGTPYEVDFSISEMRREPWHRIAVRTEAFKYIWDSKRTDQPQLYDLLADPAEKTSVCEQYPQVVSQLQVQVDVHLQRVSETTPVTAVPQLEQDEEVTRRLRDLGYLE